MNIAAGIGKWILTSIIIPAVIKMIAAYNALRKYHKQADANIKVATDYENNKPGTGPSDLP